MKNFSNPKVDHKKVLKHLYKATKQFAIIDVPPMQFLMIDGKGDPNTALEYKQAIEALYPMAYKLKFISKQELQRDYVVMPLEGLWWAKDMSTFETREKSAWNWTMMIMQPEWITKKLFESAYQQVKQSKNPPTLSKIRMNTYHEGKVVQILHIGSYDEEGPTLAKLHHEFIPENQLMMTGKHHEIYLSDPRKTSPDKLKTILRQPVKRKK